jgi:hypothetical protein
MSSSSVRWFERCFGMKGATGRAERLAGFVNLFDDLGFPSIKRVSAIPICDVLPCRDCRMIYSLIGFDDTRAIHVSVFGSIESDTSDHCCLWGRFCSVQVTCPW